MRILHLIDERWDSGLTHYALRIALLLQKFGDVVCVGVLPGKKPEALAKEMGLDTTPIDSFSSLRKYLYKREFDLINVHTGKTHTWAVLSQLLKKPPYRIPIVRTRGDARILKVNLLFKWIYSRTAAVIAASDHIRKQYEMGFGFNEESARTIYPSVECDDAPTLPPKNIVGILGRLDPVKGHVTFLEAAAQVLKEKSDVEFLVGGGEANISYETLKEFARQWGIDEKVKFLGYQETALGFMRRCSMGVIASVGSEEVSRVCLEWMGVGRAVVGTLVGCIAELIEPFETGILIPPADSSAMARAILDLLNEPDLNRKLGVNAHRIAKTQFSDQVFLDKTKRLYAWASEHFPHERAPNRPR